MYYSVVIRGRFDLRNILWAVRGTTTFVYLMAIVRYKFTDFVSLVQALFGPLFVSLHPFCCFSLLIFLYRSAVYVILQWLF